METFFDAAESQFGTVTAVIDNAATTRYGPLDDFSPAEIAAEIATKLTGSLFMARRGIQAMRHDGRGGDILFMTSLAAATPWPLHLPYTAASAGVEHAVRTLRYELEGTGIRVLNLRCGETIGTDFTTRELESGRAMDANERWYRMNLLRHTGLMYPEQVADAVVTAVTLPRGHQYSVMEVMPTAPIGPLPPTFDDVGRRARRAVRRLISRRSLNCAAQVFGHALAARAPTRRRCRSRPGSRSRPRCGCGGATSRRRHGASDRGNAPAT